ncbi:MAG: hypothetical protein AB7Q17_12885 [Phycisphaerae bacterium]
MTYLQRRWHARIWLVLGPLLLLLIAVALWARPPRLGELAPAARSGDDRARSAETDAGAAAALDVDSFAVSAGAPHIERAEPRTAGERP